MVIDLSGVQLDEFAQPFDSVDAVAAFVLDPENDDRLFENMRHTIRLTTNLELWHATDWWALSRDPLWREFAPMVYNDTTATQAVFAAAIFLQSS